MRWKSKLRTGLLLCVILGMVLSLAAAAAAPGKVTGSAGWRTYDGKQYFYDESGILQKNRIVTFGGKHQYVDRTGALVKDANIKRAVAFAVKYGKGKKTNRQKLEACYKKITKFRYVRYYKHRSLSPKKKNIPKLASRMFTRKRGYCYQYAATMAYVATVLGYQARFVSGAVRYRSHVHGWCEVKIGKEWRKLDCCRQKQYRKKSLFLKKKMPFKLIYFHRYKLNIVNQKVVWK